MRRSLLFSLFLATSASAELIYLTNERGESTGPVELKQGAQILIGSAKYRIDRLASQAERSKAALESTVIPEIDFNRTPLPEVVSTLGVIYERNRATNTPAINFLYMPAGFATTTGATSIQPASVRTNALITLKLRDVTVPAILKLLKDSFACSYTVEENIIRLFPPGVSAERLETGVFFFSPGCQRHPDAYTNGAVCVAGEHQFISPDELKTKLTGMCGTTWPPGSSVTIPTNRNAAIVVNTRDNLNSIEEVMDNHNQVSIELFIVACNKSDIDSLSRAGTVGQAQICQLWTSGKAETLSAPSITACFGQEATVRGGIEYIYPASYEADFTGTNLSNSAPAMLVPSNFEKRDVGTVFSVTPTLEQDRNTISLTVAPQLVHEPEWKSFTGKYVDRNGESRAVTFEQPFFGVEAVTTTVKVRNGELVLLGGGTPSKDRSRMIYMFVTARRLYQQPDPITGQPGLSK